MRFVPSSASIMASVGFGGMNRRDDVLLVQQLINSRLPIPFRPLKVDGNCGWLTINAIKEVQRLYLNMKLPDGRIDPNGATFRFLTGRDVQRVKASPFPSSVIASAQSSQRTWKVPASVTLAQWALESDWGKAMPAGSNNPFGIKATAAQSGVEARTSEVVKGKDEKVVAKFRKFASLEEAFAEHGRLLATASPYAKARIVIGQPDAFADALTGVYATDPNYGTKLKKIMKTYDLYQYD